MYHECMHVSIDVYRAIIEWRYEMMVYERYENVVKHISHVTHTSTYEMTMPTAKKTNTKKNKTNHINKISYGYKTSRTDV